MSEQIPEFNKVTALFGARGKGKTEFLRGNEKFKLPGFFKAALAKGQKVLIVDTINHPSYQDIPFITFEQLRTWKKGIYRIIIDPEQIAEFTAYLNSLDSLWNTLIVFEDAYKHTSERLSKPCKRLIIDSKQKNIDIIYMYHAFGWAPKDLYKVLQLIQLFKIGDHPECRKKDMPGYYEEALKTYNEVQAHESDFYSKLIVTGL